MVLTGRRELRIFKMLARYIKDSSIARNFLDILLPLLRKKDISSGMTFLQDLVIQMCFKGGGAQFDQFGIV